MQQFQFMIDCLDSHSERYPEKAAYIFLSEKLLPEKTLTFAQLRGEARQFARRLMNTTQPGDRALLILPAGLDFIIAFFGCLYAGVVAVPLPQPNKRRSQRTLQGIIDDCSPRLVITHKALDNSFQDQHKPETLSWIEMDALMDDQLPAGGPDYPVLDDQDLAFIQYTSGSTSSPKGVMVTHANIIANQTMIRQAFGHDEMSCVVGWVPHYHDQGLIGNILQPMFVGATSILMSPVTFMRWPLRWLQAISLYQAHSSGGPNFAFEACIAALERKPHVALDLSTWKIAFNGAEPVRHETLNRFQAAFARFGLQREAIYPCYGLAECTLQATGGVKGEAPVMLSVNTQALCYGNILLSDSGSCQTLVSSGRALPGTQISIVEPLTGKACAPLEVGEVWIAGPHIAKGYWNQPALTLDVFANGLSDDIQRSYLRTGDLGFIHQGELYITGRIKDTIVIRGKNYYPHDIEHSVFTAHDSLEHSACAAFSVIGTEEKLIVVQEVRRAWRKKIVLDEVVSMIRQAVVLNNEVTPHDIVLLMPGKLLKTSSGKVMRHAIRSQYLDNTLERWLGECCSSA
ncbi:fatty acyl-AMP ligase [Pseudomonas sp. FEN]|uniref:fatty acyl-AMP ligase n=1 Tax=Pseudomonas sp. FEN TaxID=2767468 RepID=UPI00174E2826|nr:fatty acyl-AMP ligase [Pseudomonas sp. FEN]